MPKKKSLKIGRIVIDNARINEACSAYFKWKDLNTYIKSNSTRGLNMHEVISEPIGSRLNRIAQNIWEAVEDI